jgi:hypothetical protein
VLAVIGTTAFGGEDRRHDFVLGLGFATGKAFAAASLSAADPHSPSRARAHDGQH